MRFIEFRTGKVHFDEVIFLEAHFTGNRKLKELSHGVRFPMNAKPQTIVLALRQLADWVEENVK